MAKLMARLTDAGMRVGRAHDIARLALTTLPPFTGTVWLGRGLRLEISYDSA